MLAEVLRCLRPAPGEVAVDCTLGGGGHARAILEAIQPGGLLIGLDVDALELPRTGTRLRAAGFGPASFVARHGSFANLPDVLAAEGLASADVIVVDLGVSAMQHDTPARGFSYKYPGPLDLRMDPSRGQTGAILLAGLSEEALAALLVAHADEPHAECIARLLKAQPIDTTNTLERVVRLGLTGVMPTLTKADVKKSVRRTFQALRIAVNNEFVALEGLLRVLPSCLSPGGRVAVLTFHSGEDRRVKKAFQAGRRTGAYAAIAETVIRSTRTETRANRRAASAKLRWAVTPAPDPRARSRASRSPRRSPTP